MANDRAIVQYVIFFQDRDEYNFAVAASGGNAIEIDPYAAAQFFNIPWPLPSGDMALIPKGIYGVNPYGIPVHPGPGAEISFPEPTGRFMKSNVPKISVPGYIGTPPSGPAGPITDFVWQGAILFQGGAGEVGDDPIPTAIPPRRWTGGCELIPFNEGGSAGDQNLGCRDASRTIDGLGMAIRGANTTILWERAPNEYTGVSVRSSWERFYFRLRTPGSSLPSFIWRTSCSAASLSGAAIRVTTGGILEFLKLNPIGTITVLGGVPINVNEWYLIDCLIKYPASTSPGVTGVFQVFINHESAGLFTELPNTDNNFGLIGFHSGSMLGLSIGAHDTTVEYDLDDWMNAEIPAAATGEFVGASSEFFNFLVGGSTVSKPAPVDWYVGSHMRAARILSLSQTGWLPAASPKILEQGISPKGQLNSTLVSSTSGALLNAVTDVNDEQDSIGLVLGPVAAVVGMFSSNDGGSDGQLGYSAAGAAAVMASVNQVALGSATSVLYRPSGLILPASIVPFNVRHTKSADTNIDTVHSIQTVVEYIGLWGLEDGDGPDIDRMSCLHNCRYPNSPWGYIGPAPDGPVYSVGGTYTGNSAQVTVNLPAPCHFLWIRPLSSGTQGIKFFGASLGGHNGAEDRVIPNLLVFMDSAFQTKFTVTGNAPDINQNGVIYQYIAFCDPGMRFNICGAFNNPIGVSSKANSLQDSDFIPIAAFAQPEFPNTTGGNVNLAYKGPAYTGNHGIVMNGTILNNWGNLSEGIFTSRADLHPGNGAQINYSVWRATDDCGNVMCQAFTYTGDGTGNRVLTRTPASGRYPLFALITNNAMDTAYMRDPSHTGANSCRADSLGNSTTAIIAGGIDTLTVGPTLNQTGVIYDVFIIPGNDTSWSNGEFNPANCEPSETPWPVPPMEPAQIAIITEGGLTLSGETALTLLKDISGIYTLVPNKSNDTLYDRQTGVANIDVKIPDPTAKTGYLGG